MKESLKSLVIGIAGSLIAAILINVYNFMEPKIMAQFEVIKSQIILLQV